MRVLNLSLAAAALSALASVMAQPASARQDGKGYPGSLCEELKLTRGFSIAVLSTGRIFNVSTDRTMELACPIVKDIDGIGGAQVRVVDQHPTDDVVCTLRTFRFDGKVNNEQTQRTVGASPLVRQLDFVRQSGAGSHYELECDVPPRSPDTSGVVMYNIVEVN